MASSISESIKEAKEELHEKISSEGVKVNESQDEIEEMKEVLEEEQSQKSRDVKDVSESVELESELLDLEDGGENNAGARMDKGVVKEQVKQEKPPISQENKDFEEDEIERNISKGDREEKEQVLEELESEVEKEQKAEDSVKSGQDLTVRERIENLESELQSLGEKVVSNESKELSEINDLERRVESLELDTTEALKERISRLEEKVDSLKSVEAFDDRLSELEGQLMKDGSFSARVEELVHDRLEDRDRRIDQLEEQVGELQKNDRQEEIEDRLNELELTEEENTQDLDDKIERLWEAFDEQMDNLDTEIAESEPVEELDGKVEKLWEALDEEVMSLESRISDDEDRIQDLMDQLIQLSEIVKHQLKDR